MKVGLVLEGGGMRGMYSAGVLDILMEQSVRIDGIVSVSAGALFGVNLPSGQKGRVLRYNKRFLGDKRYMGLYSLLTTGNIINKDFTFYEVPYTLDPFDQSAFAQSGVDFFVTLTDIATGKAEYVKITNVFAQMEYFRATSAIPFVSRAVEINGKQYLDGGISDSIPLEQCRRLGYDKIIVVLTRPQAYRKSPIPPWLPKLFYRRHPHLVATLINRHTTYNQTEEKIEALEREQQIFVIRPSQTLSVGRLEKDLNKIQTMYDLGVQDCRNQLMNLQRYLSQV